MIVDINTSLGHWPFQSFRQDTAGTLARHLRSEGISKALVSSIDAILLPDPHGCNESLLTMLKPYPELVPVMTVNPTLTGWESALAMCRTRAVKVYPGYHDYAVASESMTALARALGAAKKTLMVQVRVDDERSHHPLCRVPPVNEKELIHLAEAFPKLPIVCLCPYLGSAVALARSRPNIHFDLSMVERLDTVNALLDEVPPEQILFGSHTPFLTTRSAVMKLNACTAAPATLRKIAARNARRLFGL